jgi:uncharacterized protein (DUF1800 family)
MNSTDKRVSAIDTWAPYAPSKEAPWDLRRVAHLHRVAAFGATWEELQRDLKDGPGLATERLLTGKVRSQGMPNDFIDHSAKLARLANAGSDLGRLKAWWVYRMLLGPDPLTEHVASFWHNYFATSAKKVGMAVYRQNEIFREFGRGPFGELLRRVLKDPAMLVWLDAQTNRKGNPNENLGRELMELFTLGIGHYTERDVKEAARALTGWGVVEGHFREDPEQHDGGEKTVLGRTGHWTGDDLVKMLLDNPATANRLATRLCEHFMGEGAVDAAAIRALADGLRARNLDMGWAVRTLLQSQAFFSEANLGTRIIGPTEYVIGLARSMELFDPPPSTLILAEFIAHLGQDLFHPPNVGGWPGGREWMNARGAVGRLNYVVALLEGQAVGRSALDPLVLARRHGRAGDLETAVNFYSELFLGTRPVQAWRERLLATLGAKALPEPHSLRRAIQLILASPDAQLA